MKKRVMDAAHYRVVWTLQKWRSEEEYFGGKKPYEMKTIRGNLLLNEGIGVVWDLAAGLATPTAFNNANARIGVGDGTAAAVATQTGLQGATTAFKGMLATFPSRSAQTVSWKSEFLSAEGNQSWQEWTIDNGSVGLLNLNRKVQNLGTKASGEVWTLQGDVTLS